MHPWQMPQAFNGGTDIMDRMHPLKVTNSLTRSKVRFIPESTKRVLWYQCGPTVYAASHMGHARSYVQLDIIRRITQDYLGYNVVVCQNITDIDDKIIIRSSEQGIDFRELAAANEADFFDDMSKLGVRLPDLVTRVSEYVPEVIAYIENLCEKGYAYPSNGSVYFNTRAFEEGGHKYGKLVPEQIGNSELLAEGEGALTANDDKKNATDFVLWKKTKEHTDGTVEPSWESPWGGGRPGWHIECSVMSKSAFDTYGTDTVDVHAGGVDLKFPHHENEIAQSEGRCDCKQWVNYWLHTGHLNIQGLKMSKSLKNFITIKDSLKTHTSRQIRFLFLLHKYNVPMDYGDGTMNQAVSIEKIFSEFFLNVKAVLRRLGLNGPQHVGERERTVLLALEEAKDKVHTALLDDYDTPTAASALLELVRHANRYIEESVVSSSVLTSIGRYVTSMLRIFGLIPEATEIGFPLESASSGAENKEELLAPYLDALTNFREKVRVAAMGKDSIAVLKAADELRDSVLPELGVKMEDKGSGKDVVSVWKLEDPEVLRMERQRKEAEKAAKEEEKEANRRRLREKEEKNKIPPSEMFKSQTDLYSAFDSATGIPTHDKAGEPLSKKSLKRLEKEYEKQKDAHAKYLASQKA
eukprot:CAMPEP_0114448774 /NCGR_PEP_ID=MMETSP0103-20121206/20511_1 /TAXON_ID=37642 ORGANISM="Paraphysomonas imperforata, Strain PA2" /NCGR_SAMPLE_ID=MMETSP0103 /ASSEMBLY_ACC=CAM_ASM_000201 /LENGTH=637 /DNA_ID=CAMNT_0001620825 /DNA_START=13 /DNA_END=1926 /DNA_ORIENTATION=-